MVNLKENTNINLPAIKSYIVRVVSREISNLTKPCYEPPMKKCFYDLLKLTNIKEKDLKEYTKDKWKNTKYKTLNLQNDRITNFYIFLMTEALNKGDIQLYQFLVIFSMIRYYASRFKIHFKYCQPDVFRYTLDIITKSHLFAREKTIGNSIYYLGIEVSKRYQKAIKNDNTDQIGLFINESRHRIAQSLRSFAEAYYLAVESGKGYKEQPEQTDSEEGTFIPVEKSKRSIDEITKKITIYKQVDIKAQEEARQLTKISSSIATQITKTLSQTQYTDIIRIIYSLYIKNIDSVDLICGKEYYEYVRKLMSIKRSKSQIYFKQQINVLLTKVFTEMNYIKSYNSFTNQTKYQNNLFFAYYITLMLRKLICYKV